MYNYSLELEKYREGIIELLFYNPPLGSIARSMGQPVFDEDHETAYITFDNEGKVRFCFNPDFIMSLDVDMLAAVISHEAYHLALYHLEEMKDKVTFPHQHDLTVAQECVINDTIENVHGMKMPDFVYRGMDVIQEDCSQYSSKQVYDKLPHEEHPPGEGGCGGIHISEEDLDKYHKEIEEIIKDAAKQSGKSVDEFMKDIRNSATGGYAGTMQGNMSTARMNWRRLLANINPKVMTAGGRKKTKNNWLKNNRRMISVYPKVIMPSQEVHDPIGDDIGDDLPTLVIALDLSGSIPMSLVDTLRGLLNDIPTNLMRAYPCTWSSNLIPYDPNVGRVCYQACTNISLVVKYVNKIQRETGVDPYVLVITDGDYWLGHEKPGKDWFYMAVNKLSISKCRRHAADDDHVYLVNDFMV